MQVEHCLGTPGYAAHLTLRLLLSSALEPPKCDDLISKTKIAFHFNLRHYTTEMKTPEAAVLHYTYTTFKDILARKNRCDCPKDEESLKQCFILVWPAVRKLTPGLHS